MPAAKRELAELTAFAAANGFDEPTLALWDVPFWSERQSEKKFGFEEEELRPYAREAHRTPPHTLTGAHRMCDVSRM